MKKIILTLVLIGAFVQINKLFWNYYKADVNYKTERNLFEEGKAVEALPKINAAIENNPNEPAYYRERAKNYLVLGANQDMETKKELKKYALADLSRSLQLNPQNLATIRNNTAIYYYLAVDDLNKPGTADNVDSQYINLVEQYLTKYKNEYKNDLGVQVLVSTHEKKLGLNENYNETLENIKRLRPDVLKWHPDLINSQ